MKKNFIEKKLRQLLFGSSRIIFWTSAIILTISSVIKPACQQNVHLCPKVCHCDEQNYEVLCNGPFEASGLPHTLNPATKKLTINHAQTSQFSGTDLALYGPLEILDLAFNKLTSIDFDNLKSNTYLITLNASHNSIVDLRDSALSSVISRINQNERPPSFTTTERASSESLEPDEIKKLRKSRINVMELDLSYNQITTLRNFLFMRWHKLQRLDLSHNSIVTLDSESLYGLNKLEHINLQFNRLVQVPALAFRGTARSPNHIGSQQPDTLISALKTIDMSGNPLISIGPNSFITLGQTQTINLDSCAIRSIEDQAFEGLSSITTLSLANNDLTEVPSEALRTIGSLKVLNMNANDIHIITPYAFKNLCNLEELFLNNGSLRELEAQAFNGLNSLKKLDLSHNTNLKLVDATLLDNLPMLTYLNLYRCSLISLAASESIANHPITILDLRNNYLNCDCDLKWLTRHMKKLNETVMSVQQNKAHLDSQVRAALLDLTLMHEMLNLTCSGPPALSGELVIGLPLNKLECIQPNSPLNLHIGFVSLFLLILALTITCMVNFYRNEKHLISKLKKNIVQKRNSQLSPYTQDLSKSVDNNQNKETHIEFAEYEPVDYGPIYTIPSDQYMTPTSQQHTHQL